MKIRFLLIIVLLSNACSAIHTIKKSEASAYLHLEVRPKTAIVYVDEQLYGEIYTFRGQIIGLRPGMRRVEIRAEGFESERYDLQLNSGEELTLTLTLVSKLDIEDQKTKKKRNFLQRPNP